jgi:hypothetical protein
MADIPYTPRAPSAAFRAVAVTKSDDTVYDPPLQSLWIGGTGNVAVIPAGQDDVVTFTAVGDGVLLPIAVSKVMAATSATNIIGLR